jgi:hypothetical protein
LGTLPTGSFTSSCLNTPDFTDERHIAEALATGRDLFDREDQRFEFVPLGETYPRYILEHRERFREWIKPLD